MYTNSMAKMEINLYRLLQQYCLQGGCNDWGRAGAIYKEFYKFFFYKISKSIPKLFLIQHLGFPTFFLGIPS